MKFRILFYILLFPSFLLYGDLKDPDHDIQFDEFAKKIESLLNHEFISLHPIFNKTSNRTVYLIGARNAIFLLQDLQSDSEPNLVWNGTDIANDRKELNGSSIGMTLPLNTNWVKDQTEANFTFVYDDCMYSRINYSKVKNFDTGAFGNIRRKNHIFDESLINFTCYSIFIKHVALIEDPPNRDYLWVCGTFGGYPRAFKLDAFTFEFLGYSDRNVFVCARDIDEPMAFLHSKSTNNFFIGTSHGFYKPNRVKPDVPYNNSTVLYADWMPFLNNFQILSDLSIILGSDVNFIPKIYETEEFIYAFGSEINKEYGYINKMNRDSWMSFMIRVCKNDPGYNYTGMSLRDVKYSLHNNTHPPYRRDKSGKYPSMPTHKDLGYNPKWWGETAHLPTKHFISAAKFNFGCYIQRFYQSQAFNYFRGASNSIYLNRLVDVFFDPNGDRVRNPTCANEYHLMDPLPLVAAFNGPGLNQFSSGTGAICQFKVDDWKVGNLSIMTPNFLKNEKEYYPNNFEHFASYGFEAFDLFATYKKFLRGQDYRRVMGGTVEGLEDLTPPLFTLTKYNSRNYKWNDPKLQITLNDYYFKSRKYIGSCGKDPDENMNDIWFSKYNNVSSFTWPLEYDQRSSAPYLQGCEPNFMHLYGDNAVFVMEGVQFKRMIVIKDKIINYEYHLKWKTEKFQPALMYVLLVSTKGVLYRVVMCDITMDQENFDRNAKLSKENRFDLTQLYCHFKNSDQPKIRIHQTNPMEDDDDFTWAKYLVKSSLISELELDLPQNKIDPYGDIVKDVVKQDDELLITHFGGIVNVPLVNCSTYTQCKHCASDPFCMWNDSIKSCVLYSKEKKIVGLQDVLSRGWKCYGEFLSKREVNEISIYTDDSNRTNIVCTNSGYFRGSFYWTINGQKINFKTKKSRNDYLLDSQRQIVSLLNPPSKSVTMTCVGMNEDMKIHRILGKFKIGSFLEQQCCRIMKEKNIDICAKEFFQNKCEKVLGKKMESCNSDSFSTR